MGALANAAGGAYARICVGKHRKQMMGEVMRVLGRWVKRHPFWTLLIIVVILMGVSPGNADAAAGLAILLVPFAIAHWILTKVRSRQRQQAAHPRRSIGIDQPRKSKGAKNSFGDVESREMHTKAGSSSAATGNASTFVEQTVSEPLPSDSVSAFAETAHRPMQVSKAPEKRENLITLRDMLDMSPTEFEEFCVQALEGIGYKDVKRVGGAGDLAADIFATDQYGKSTIVQCKRYKPGSKIGSPTIQTFIGMKNVHHQADRGIFMTTADYSVPAIRLAKQHDLILIDGDDMVKIAGLVMAPRRVSQPQSAASGSRFCTSCGAEFDTNERFCGLCGSPRRGVGTA